MSAEMTNIGRLSPPSKGCRNLASWVLGHLGILVLHCRVTKTSTGTEQPQDFHFQLRYRCTSYANQARLHAKVLTSQQSLLFAVGFADEAPRILLSIIGGFNEDTMDSSKSLQENKEKNWGSDIPSHLK